MSFSEDIEVALGDAIQSLSEILTFEEVVSDVRNLLFHAGLLFRGALRINLRSFFTVTNVLLILFALSTLLALLSALALLILFALLALLVLLTLLVLLLLLVEGLTIAGS